MGGLRWVGGAFVFIFWRLNTPRIIQAQKNNYPTDKLEMLSGAVVRHEFSLCTDVPPPSEKIGRRDICESPSLIVFWYTFA